MRKTTIFVIILFVISVGVAAASWFVRTSRSKGAYPVITMEEGSIEVPVGADDAAILAGITAYDAEDGDLTDRLIVEGMSRFISTGRRSAKIGVVDSTDKVTEISREIIYTDYESPKFSLTAPLIFTVGTSKLDGVIRAEDMIDGDITGKIRMKTDVSDLGDRAGTYRVTFTCSNSLGDTTEIPLSITYDNSTADNTYPKITLTDYLIYVEQGEWVNLWDYVDSLTADRLTFHKNTEHGEDVLRVPGTEPEEPDEEENEGEDGEDIDEDEIEDTDEDTEDEEINEEGEEFEERDPNVVRLEDFDISFGGLNSNVPGVYEVTFYFTDSQDRTGKTTLVVVVEGPEAEETADNAAGEEAAAGTEAAGEATTEEAD